MEVSCRNTLLLFEAGEALGIPRARLVAAHGLDVGRLSDGARTTDWATVVAVMSELSRQLGDDPERLREVGRRMVRLPSYGPVRAIAGTLVSVRRLYEFSERWMAPASFPHLDLTITYPASSTMEVRLVVPEPHAPSVPFFHIFQGIVETLPELLGADRTLALEAHVTPRTFHLRARLPASPSVLGRARRRVHALLHSQATVEILEHQREQLTASMRALTSARDELRSVLERLPDMVVVHVEGEIVWANRATLRTLGYAHLDDITGTPLLEIVAPPFRPLVARRMAMPADAPGTPELTEALLRTRDGTEVAVEVAPPQAIVFGGVAARLLVGRDITERASMQQRLVTADRLASIGLLAAGVAHEINNPLAYVLNNIEMARRDVVAGAPPERSEIALTTALEGVDRIRGIVRDLLKLSRGEDVALVPTDVGAVVDSTLALAAEEIRVKARLVRDAAPSPLACASEGRVAQVLLNLVSNALGAMESPSPEDNELAVRTGTAADGRALLEVSDNGVGIAPEHLRRVFEPFFTTKPAGRGTGLGLAITQRLVIDLGGEIDVAPRSAGGTSVRVVLPTVDGASGGPVP